MLSLGKVMRVCSCGNEPQQALHLDPPQAREAAARCIRQTRSKAAAHGSPTSAGSLGLLLHHPKKWNCISVHFGWGVGVIMACLTCRTEGFRRPAVLGKSVSHVQPRPTGECAPGASERD